MYDRIKSEKKMKKFCQFLMALILFFIFAERNSFAACNMSSEYSYSGADPNMNIFGQTYPNGFKIEEAETCYLITAGCYYDVKIVGVLNGNATEYGTTRDVCAISNSSSGGTYGCSMDLYSIHGSIAAGYPASKIDSLFYTWLNNGNSTNWGQGFGSGTEVITKTVINKICEAQSSLLLKDILPADVFETQNQEKTVCNFPSSKKNSIIDTRVRSLGQSILIAGTNVSLTYTLI